MFETRAFKSAFIIHGIDWDGALQFWYGLSKYKTLLDPLWDEYTTIIIPILTTPIAPGVEELAEKFRLVVKCRNRLSKLILPSVDTMEIFHRGMYYAPCTMCKHKFFGLTHQCELKKEDKQWCKLSLVLKSQDETTKEVTD